MASMGGLPSLRLVHVHTMGFIVPTTHPFLGFISLFYFSFLLILLYPLSLSLSLSGFLILPVVSILPLVLLCLLCNLPLAFVHDAFLLLSDKALSPPWLLY